MTETTATPAPGTTTDLRDRLQRAIGRLAEKRDQPGQHPRAASHLDSKIEGVKLALSYIHDGERMAAVPGATPPALVVTPGLVQEFEATYRAMLHEDTKPIRQRDVRLAVRVYAQTDLLAGMLRDSGVQDLPEDEPGSVLVVLRDLLGMRDGQSFADAEV